MFLAVVLNEPSVKVDKSEKMLELFPIFQKWAIQRRP